MDDTHGSISANARGDVAIGFARSGFRGDSLGPGFAGAFATVVGTTGGVLSFAANPIGRTR